LSVFCLHLNIQTASKVHSQLWIRFLSRAFKYCSLCL
jgi:hypothetical protein